MKLNDFRADLEYSEDPNDEPFWQEFYKKAFPDMVINRTCPGNTPEQWMGIDRKILLASGLVINIQEKKRRKYYPDILLEIISNDKTGALGWMEKQLQIDYFAYAKMPRREIYLFDWQALRQVWLKYREQWLKKYGTRKSLNLGYTTINVPVPDQILLNAIFRAMRFQL